MLERRLRERRPYLCASSRDACRSRMTVISRSWRTTQPHHELTDTDTARPVLGTRRLFEHCIATQGVGRHEPDRSRTAAADHLPPPRSLGRAREPYPLAGRTPREIRGAHHALPCGRRRAAATPPARSVV